MGRSRLLKKWVAFGFIFTYSKLPIIRESEFQHLKNVARKENNGIDYLR